jgi:nicotinate-nucleotide pyrophosphorylase (carboxylating)
MKTIKITNSALKDNIKKNVAIALIEDIKSGDLSSKLISKSALGYAKVIAKQEGILCGIPWFNETFRLVNKKIKIIWNFKEGEKFNKNQCLCEISGSAKDILTAERTALNFLQTLSSTSTSVHNLMKIIKGTRTKIFDTRKTIPGLRIAQKYAVLVGGGNNQRFGLYDQILIKENHIRSNPNLKELLMKALNLTTYKNIQIEVECLKELSYAIDVGYKNILLDNFSLSDISKAMSVAKNKAILEASGNITKKNIKKIALTGIPRISLGCLTKNINAVDLSLRMVKVIP